MKSAQVSFRSAKDFNNVVSSLKAVDPHVVFAFGDCSFFADSALAGQMHSTFPSATVIGCSTAGEIANDEVLSGEMVLTAVRFKDPRLKFAIEKSNGIDDSEGLGGRIAEKLAGADLTSIFVLLQGVDINGSAVIAGIQKKVGSKVVVTGGLAGDNTNFKKTFVMLNENVLSAGAVAFGVYGNSVKVSYGSAGGWEAFGPTRKVTKAAGNILSELDGTPALSVYKEYLGEFAKELPGSALHFPLTILSKDTGEPEITRTILGVDEAKGSLVLAGDMPQGCQVRLMHSQLPKLVSGAETAAEMAGKSFSKAEASDSMGVLVSCVGRKLVVGEDDIVEEVEAARSSLHGIPVTGFYSYGEICPTAVSSTDCRLHNQTMTITVFRD